MKLLPKAGAHRRRHAGPRPVRPRLAMPEHPAGRGTSSKFSLPRLSLPRPTLARLLPPRPSFARLPLSRLTSSGPPSVPSSSAPERRRETPVERRRARALLGAAVIFALVVFVTTFPLSTLVAQHRQLASDSARVTELQAENKVLGTQERQLSDVATQAGLARQDYGLVKPGQKAYDILPPARSSTAQSSTGQASSGTAASEAGHVPLNEPPVAPGSKRSQELLTGNVGSTVSSSSTAAATGASHRQPKSKSAGATAPTTSAPGGGGFWSRVGHTLEFWS